MSKPSSVWSSFWVSPPFPPSPPTSVKSTAPSRSTPAGPFLFGPFDPLNGTLIFAPECAAAAPLPPGASQELTGLGVGNHSFQCCIHPWMRMLIKVESEEAEEEHKH